MKSGAPGSSAPRLIANNMICESARLSPCGPSGAMASRRRYGSVQEAAKAVEFLKKRVKLY
jgi:hypothetical protein